MLWNYYHFLTIGMELFVLILKFVIGLLMVIKGADWLTDGASSIAHKFNISSLVIGLTVVAFGTSAPELVVSTVAASGGNSSAIAIGNVLGSNIFNILAIVGIVALVYPIPVTRGNLHHDVPLCILASIVMFVMAMDVFVDSNYMGNIISRGEGITLLAFFGIFLTYTFSMARKTEETKGSESEKNVQKVKDYPIWKSSLIFLVGLAVLIFGGDLFVDGASGIATSLGIKESVVAVTIVALGTSFPELFTSVMAARKGNTDMALGNVIGSNLFNIFFVLGVASVVHPLDAGTMSKFDLFAMIGSAVLFWVFCLIGKQKLTISRGEGLIMVLCMLCYYAYQVFNATQEQ